jgi:hypothetical protein
MRDWYCRCGQLVISGEKPQPIHWTDGHVCTFKDGGETVPEHLEPDLFMEEDIE